MKGTIRRTLGRLGYDLRKSPRSPFRPLPVFDLAIHYLMGIRGRSLKFIQVGANDGVFGDPLRKYIIEFEWRGLLVEPQPDIFNKLQSNYADVGTGVHFENSAVSNVAGQVTMYRARPSQGVGVSDYQSSVASLSHRTAAAQLKLGGRDLEQISVSAVRLDDSRREASTRGLRSSPGRYRRS